jgi:DMSO reductase family type II enzyme heme b subunit
MSSHATVEAQVISGSITSYRVTGSVDFTSPGSESFWTSIPWTQVPLGASVSPGGGHTPQVEVKSANDGFNIFMLFRWNDSQPSYIAPNELYRAANGSLVPLTPAATQNVTQLFYNSTYYYPDRVAMLWFVGGNSSRQQSPAMQLGSDGAITGGAANIWHWQSNPTDDNPNDAGFPGGYTDPTGAPIYPPDNLSFAEDDYTNMTGFYVIGGSFGQNTPNLAPYSSPYEILVGNEYSQANKTWTVEMERSFTTDATQYRVQLSPGSTDYVAFAVWQGALGESADLKSVSEWYTLTIGTSGISTTATSSTASTFTSTSTVTQTVSEVVQEIPTDAYAGMAILLIVGLIIGLVLHRRE